MILDKLVEATRKRIERDKRELSLEELKQLAGRTNRPAFLFEERLRQVGLRTKAVR